MNVGNSNMINAIKQMSKAKNRDIDVNRMMPKNNPIKNTIIKAKQNLLEVLLPPSGI
jgi:hypothetical protein